ncbi:MAG: indolepyruvate oxidoreductase subunit beta [Firmicutes bacterium]|nr:indolepyruvate oxidoreductase subunit beta [Bacillota bacterium]
MAVTSILLCGVGGQGAILISRILTEGLCESGYDVKQCEDHGMAQRGGSVTTQVRFGDKVYGPVFGQGQADIMIALEKMEAVRCAGFLKPDGIAIINDYRQDSSLTASGLAEYPEGCVESMQEQFKTVVVKAEEIAKSLGNAKCMNVVLFGAASEYIGAGDIDWEEVVSKVVPEKHRELNIAAFKAGREAAR